MGDRDIRRAGPIAATRRHAAGVASALATLAVVCVATTVTLAFVAHRPTTVGDLVWVTGYGGFAVIGGLVVRRDPTQAVGWMFLGAGTIGAVTDAIAGYAYLATTHPMPLGDVAGWASAWSWAPSLGLVVLALSRFPTGRPSGWVSRWAGRVGVATTLFVALVNAVGLWPFRSATMALDGAEEAIDSPAITTVGIVFPFVLLAAIVSMAALVARYRRSEGIERLQLKWLAVWAIIGIPSIVLGETLVSGGPAHVVLDVLGAPVWLAVAAGLAILRYRLYDIDRIISRTLAWTALTLVLVAMYALGVMGLGALARSVTGEQGDLVVATPTLIVAAAFQPVRRRVQSVVDRRFNRAGYDGVLAIEAFGQRLRTEVDTDVIRSDLRHTVVRTIAPARVDVVLFDRAFDA